MARVVVYTLLTTAFVVFLVFAPTQQCSRNNLGLNRRLGNQFRRPIFDPLVSKMERLAEEKRGSSDNQKVHSNNNDFENDISESSEVEEELEYFSEEGKLNVTLRLLILFPLLDNAPEDGFVSFDELQAWNLKQATDRLSYRTQREMELHDKNEDGSISFDEILPQFSQEDIEKNRVDRGEVDWWKEQFMNADVDQDGNLNFDELNNFLHPEESNNDAIHLWLLRDKLKNKRMDLNEDGKLNFEEFLDHPYNIYKSYMELEAIGAKIPTAEEKFNELDVNKNNLLEVEELQPIFSYLYPGELSFTKYYTGYLIREADDNKDGKLTLDEMLNHEYIFYSTVYDDNDYDDYHLFHDEL